MKFNDPVVILVAKTVFLLVVFRAHSIQAAASANEEDAEYCSIAAVKVGPYANPYEAFPYFSLPFCRYNGSGFDSSTSSTSLASELLARTRRDQDLDVLSCTTAPLDDAQARLFEQGIRNRYFFQFLVDNDLPVWGMLGETLEYPRNTKKIGKFDEMGKEDQLKPSIYQNRTLTLKFNDRQLVRADLHSDIESLKRVLVGQSYTFQLTIKVQQTDERYDHRFERYLDHHFFEHPVRQRNMWNAVVTVVFLGLGLFAVFQRLKQHQSTPTTGQESSLPLIECTGTNENGWKRLEREEVFRSPQLPSLFAALLGIGWQLIVLSFGIVLWMSVTGKTSLNYKEGEMLRKGILGHGITSIVAGYISAYFGREFSSGVSMEQRAAQRLKTALLAVLLFPTVLGFIFSVVNMQCARIGSVYMIPTSTIIHLFLRWGSLAIPLCAVGTFLGNYYSGCMMPGSSNVPSVVLMLVGEQKLRNYTKRPLSAKLMILLSGAVINFGILSVETYYLMASLWVYKIYLVGPFTPCIMVLFAMTSGVVSSFTILMLLTASKTNEWQWTAFLASASTGIFTFAYSIYFYCVKTQMHGLFQGTVYFGYMFLVSLSVGLASGAMGHAGARRFVQVLYVNLKAA